MGQTAAQKKRSEAAKKAAATRKANQEAEQQSPDDSNPEKDVANPYRPRHTPLKAADLDQGLAEDQRQAELDAERQIHNERTGDASLA